MVKLSDEDIQTREVLDWRGVHLFHFQVSSCSQKTRIFLALKDGDWTPHEINLPQQENFEPWYLGINPRGLVPCLVLDGEVHIESNDIITLLDDRFDGPDLIPPDQRGQVDTLLRHENDLHFPIRTLTFRYFLSDGTSPFSTDTLEKLQRNGSGTVGGAPDPLKTREVEYWQNVIANEITDDAIRQSAATLRRALDELDRHLASRPYLLGDTLSVLDIAWYVYVNRMRLCGYPLRDLHGRVADWFDRLDARAEFHAQVATPPPLRDRAAAIQASQAEAGRALPQLMGL